MSELLTIVSMFDSRTVGVETVEAWHTILEPYDYQTAVTVVRNHFASQTAFLMPAHIVTGCKAAKRPVLVSDRSYYCDVHFYPRNDCPRCDEDA